MLNIQQHQQDFKFVIKLLFPILQRENTVMEKLYKDNLILID